MEESYLRRLLQRAWTETKADIGLTNKKQVMIKVAWVAVFFAIAGFFDWDEILAAKLGEVSAGLVTFAALLPIVFVLNLLNAPWRIDQDQSDEIRNLKRQVQAKEVRQDAIDRLWELRAEGVNLRNRLITENCLDSWLAESTDWECRVFVEAGKVSTNLEKWLRTLDNVRPELRYRHRSIGKVHQKRRNEMAEVLARLQEFLEAEMLDRDIRRLER